MVYSHIWSLQVKIMKEESLNITTVFLGTELGKFKPVNPQRGGANEKLVSR